MSIAKAGRCAQEFHRNRQQSIAAVLGVPLRPRGVCMKVLAVHPSGLMYTRVFLRLEPLGLETVAAVLRAAAHEVRLLDLQVESHRDLERLIRKWRPDAVCFSGNYLANIPEIIDLSKAIKAQWPDCFVFVGGHSASFTAADMLKHADGAIDCVLRGEGEAKVAELLDAVARH